MIAENKNNTRIANYLSLPSVHASGVCRLGRCARSATLLMQQMQHRFASIDWSVVAQVILFGEDIVTMSGNVG